MTKRLQILVEDEELSEIKRAARRRRLSVAEWVRQSLRTARATEGGREPKRKLETIREAIRHAFPSADIEEMLAEIERGYDG